MTFDQPAIIFCATQRSGSTMIVDDFQNATGRVGTETEAFYHLAIKRGIQDWPKALEIVQYHRQGEAIFFDKFMFPFLPILSNMMASEGVPNSTDCFAKFFASAIWVYIRRANILEQTVSKYIAETLGIWDAATAIDDFNAAMNFDVNLARKYMRGLIKEDARWLGFFKRHDIKPIQIFYEDAVPNFPNYLRPVLSAAGLQIDFDNLNQRRRNKLGNARSAVLAQVLENVVQRDLIAQMFKDRAAQGPVGPNHMPD